jgi:hypothetical protein
VVRGEGGERLQRLLYRRHTPRIEIPLERQQHRLFAPEFREPVQGSTLDDLVVAAKRVLTKGLHVETRSCRTAQPR